MNIFLFYDSFQLDIPNGNTHQISGFISAAKIKGHKIRCFQPDQSNAIGHKNISRKFSEPFFYKFEKIKIDDFASGEILKSADVIIVQAELEASFLREIVKKRKKWNKSILLLHDREGKLINDPFLFREISDSVDGIIHRDIKFKKSEKPFFFMEDSIDLVQYYPRKSALLQYDFAIMANHMKGKKKRINTIVNDIYPGEKMVLLGDNHYRTSSNNINHLGWKENKVLPDIFSSSSVYLDFPPKNERHELRLPVLEASACGSVVVSLHENTLLEDKKDYFFAKDIHEMAHYANELKQSAVLRSFMSTNVRRKINRFFTSWHRFKEFEKIIDTIKSSSAIPSGTGGVSTVQNIPGRSPVS